jgi:hypothetical protein
MTDPNEPFDLFAAIKDRKIRDNLRRSRLLQNDPDYLEEPNTGDYEGDTTIL